MKDAHAGEVVVPDTALLQSMSHPLRMRLVGLLRVHGPSTATKLAERCGESSGLTSYHLRQLADAGLIVEAGTEDLAGVVRTGGRERWWRTAHQVTYVEPPEDGDEASGAATIDFMRAVLATYSRNAHNWLAASHAWPKRWQEASGFGDLIFRLTSEEAGQLKDELWDVLSRYRKHHPADRPGAGNVPADAVIVSLQFQLFPYPDQEPPDDPPEPGSGGPA